VSLGLKNNSSYLTIKALKLCLEEVEREDGKHHNTEVPCHL